VSFHALFDLDPAERDELRTLAPDAAIAAAAAARDGVLSHPQLRALGLSASAIGRRVERRLLFPRYRGVYAVGRYDLTRRGRLRAALLRSGRSAALSHHTAGTEHDVLAARERIALTVAARPGRAGAGLELHLTRIWQPGDVVWVHGLPCTSLTRTLVDLAAGASRPFTRAWNAADQQLLLDVGALGREIARGRAGAGVLRARLERYDAAPPTESELENRFLEVWGPRSSRAPICQWPLAQTDRSGRVDFVWLPERVAVEVDGRRWHAIQAAHDADRERDLALRDAGFDPHRYTWRQVVDQGPRVADAVARALAGRSVRP
jgi:Protein of unknown function (DUF559)